MGYPVGPLLQSLAERVLENLRIIDKMAPKSGGSDPNRPPFSDTQLLISLLGVLVFPQERAPEALGDLLQGYTDLKSVVTVIYPEGPNGSVELVGEGGVLERVDPTNIKDLPRLLRNSIAHFNIRPIKKNGLFGGVRIWNKDDEGRITMVADLDFDTLRPLAEHILLSLTHPTHEIRLCDPEDPLETLKRQKAPSKKERAPPKISNAVWGPMLAARKGDYDAAKEDLDRFLGEAVRKIKEAKRRQ
jgi:hypothetical protein